MAKFLALLFLVISLVYCETLKLQKPIAAIAKPSRSVLPTIISPLVAPSRTKAPQPAKSSTLATVKTPKKLGKSAPKHAVPQTKENNRPHPTKAASYLSTYTDFYGTVLGCTALTTLSSAINSYQAGDVACSGEAVPITSIGVANTPEIEAPLSARPTGANATPASFTNCKPTPIPDSSDTWCVCDGGYNQYMKNYTDSLTTKLLCHGDNASGDWVLTPLDGPGSSDWMQDPEAAVCKDVGADSTSISQAICWEKLGIDSYIEWWWDSFNSSCPGDTNSTAFADCFMNKVMNNAPNDCSNFYSPTSCKAPTYNSKDPLAWNTHRNFWVSMAIWKMNQFFFSYYEATSTAAGNLEGRAEEIATAINNAMPTPTPPSPPDSALDDILSIFSFGLSFIPGPEAEIMNSIVGAAQQVNGLMSQFFPTDTSNSQTGPPTVDSGEVKTELSDVLSYYNQQLQIGLHTVMSSVPAFRAMSSNGTFISPPLSLPEVSQGLEDALTVFLVSQSLQSLDIFVTRSPDTSVAQFGVIGDDSLPGNGTQLNWHPNCTSYDERWSTCDTWFFDNSTKTTYSFVIPNTQSSMNNWAQNFDSMMQALFGTYITDPRSFFEQAAACGSLGKQTSPSISLNTPKPQLNCLVDISVCTWDVNAPARYKWQADPHVFTDCNSTAMFNDLWGTPGCYGWGAAGGWSMPRGYLGWAALNNDAFINSGLTYACNS